MIFTPKQARAIATGRVTLLYLPVRRGRAGAPFAPIVLKAACDYPVATRGGSQPLATIRVLERRREPLSALTLQRVRAAGYRTTDDFREAWVRRHDRAWITRHKVDLAAVFGDDACAAILRERFTSYWAQRDAWAIDVAVLSDRPRFMARQRGRAIGDGQYTPIAADAIDGAEAVPARWLDREAAKRAEHSERMRASFRVDLEAERQRRRNLRVKPRPPTRYPSGQSRPAGPTGPQGPEQAARGADPSQPLPAAPDR